MSAHPAPRHLEYYALGKCRSEIEAETIARHLEGCETCRRAVEQVPPDPFLAKLRVHAPAPAPVDRSDDPDRTVDRGPAPAAEALPTVPGFEVTAVIGRGGMGVVYAARDVELDRNVALKTVRAGPAGAGPAVLRFHREARITARLQHLGVPPVHKFGQLPDGSPYLAMKLIRGRTLAELLGARAPADELPRFVQLFEQVCHVVACAHSKGVIHRDLKPSNVMVGEFGEVQVMDWGLAKELGAGGADGATGFWCEAAGGAADETRDGSVLGTPAYMAPEQARGEGARVGPAADVFALGATLCELLTGRPAFRGTRVAEVLARAARGDTSEALDRLDGCGADPELVDLAKACLAADPGDRPPTGKAVAERVAAYRAGVEDRVRRAELDRAAAEARVREQRRKRYWQLAAALLLAGAGAGAWAWDHEAARRRGEDEKRAVRDAEAINSLIDQCRAALKAEDAVMARALFREIEKRTREGAGREPHDAIERCRRDLAMLERLDGIDAMRWTIGATGELTADDPERASGEEVVALSSRWGGDPARAPRNLLQHKKAPARWREAFAQFGIALGATKPDEAARLVHESAIADRLIGVLDHWLVWEPSEDLLAVLRVTDPDRYRNAVRAALRREDVKEVQKLADRPEALALPPRFAFALGERKVILAPARRLQILAAADRQRPGDFVLLMTLGTHYPANQKEGAAERMAWFQAAVAVRPTSTVAWNNLGVAKKDFGDLDGAAAAYREALRLDPNHAAAHNNLGVALLETGDPAAPLPALRDAVRLDPQDAVAWANLGTACRRARRLDEAADAFRRAVALDPADVNSRQWWGRVLFEKGELKGAEAVFREAVRRHPDSSACQVGLGKVLGHAGDREGQRAAYERAIALDPKNAQAHVNLGVYFSEEGSARAAEAEWLEAIRLSNHAGAHFNLGLLRDRRNDRAGAAACYRAAIAADPRYADAYLNLGTLLGRDKEWAEMARVCQEGVKGAPTDARLRSNLGFALRHQGRFEAAAAEYRTALDLDPKCAQAHNGIGYIRLCQKDYRGAAEAFERAVDADRTYSLATFYLGVALSKQGKTREAGAAYARAVELGVKLAPSHNNLGFEFARLKDWEAAADQMREAIRLEPEDRDYPFHLGLILADQGRLDEAEAVFRDLVARYPTFARGHYNVGLVRAEKSDQKAAIAAFRAAIRIDPKFAEA
ncbi:MAG: tetratricopeptide repeat protein, partial [Planctomycetes bacterium]|nr:tetratricopeptide repeat protein [Planctomycetota bacterium]